jgi:drug/metabolite transporter (DMT)-like permease
MGGAEAVPLLAVAFGLLVGTGVALLPSRMKPWVVLVAAAIPVLSILVSMAKEAHGPGYVLEALSTVMLLVLLALCPAAVAYLAAYFAVTAVRSRVAKVLELSKRGK